jgi:RNA polymerase sigma factor (sigma-70 family)
MPGAPPNPFLHHLRHLVGGAPEAGLSDGQLLERFLADRDEAAVAVLVRRYGPLVFGACRRVLGHAQAAEDAFQATFLVLVRKAPSLDRGRPLGAWLYTVAYRLALSARANELRRRRSEAQAARRRPPTEDRAASPGDLAAALEEELQRLPERHRAPLVLCYLEGKTNEQAAEILGCPRGSMFARLAQARERLRAGLARRGYAVPAAGLAAVLAATAAEAAVPLPLLANTVRAALWFAGEQAGSTGFVSAQAVALARGACHALLAQKLKLAGAVLLAAAMLGAGGTLLLKAAPQAARPPAQARPDRAEVGGEPLPDGALARMGTTRLRHGDAVSFAAYTPDGQALVTASRDRTVRLWDLATGKELRRFHWGEVQPDSKPQPPEDGLPQRYEQHFWDVTARSCQAALSSDGKIVAASRGGVVCLWETATGKKLRDLQTGQKRLVQLAFAADGKSLLTLGPGQATAVWEVATGTCVRRGRGQPAAPAATELASLFEQIAVVSPGCKYLAWQHVDPDGPNSSIHIRDLATGKEMPQIKTSPIATALTFSPDDKTLVWFSLRGGIVVSDVATGQGVRHLGGVSVNLTPDIALSADGKSLAVSRADHTIDLYDLTLGKQTGRVGRATDVDCVKSNGDIIGALVRPALAFSPDGTRLVYSLGGATVRQFHADTGEEIPGPAPGPRAPVSALALSADGKSLWTCGRGEPPRCWDWATGREVGHRGVPGSATHAVLTSEGRFAFAEGDEVAVCGPDGEKRLKIATGRSRLIALALSPDGALLATRSGSGREVHLWDMKGKERHTLGGAGDAPEVRRGILAETTGVVPPDLVFSSDGHCLAGAGPRRQLCLWDTATGALLWELAPQAGRAVERFAFSPGGRCLAAVDADRTVTLYEAVTGKKRGQLGEPDPKTRTVDLTGLSAFSYLGWRQDAPVCLAFSPDGRYLATAQEAPEIRLWDVLGGREAGRLPGHEGGVASLLFAPDGRHLFSGGADTTALTWDLARLTKTGSGQSARLPPQAREALWADLAGADAVRAFGALRTLSASPDQAVPLLKERLRPASPADPKRLARLLADLESDGVERRRQAEAELEGLGELAGATLRQALDRHPPLGLRQRLERLRDKLRVPTPGQLRDVRAVELLELIGSAEARQLLQALAGGAPGARLTREARSAVQRLSQQAVTP